MGISAALSACAEPPIKASAVTAAPASSAAEAAAPTLAIASGQVPSGQGASGQVASGQVASGQAASDPSASDQAAPDQSAANGPVITGTASWYRTGYRLHRTYSGQMLNNNAFTAASTVLPMGTVVRVARTDGSGSVVVRVNDRMPYNHRLIDLSEMAAKELGMMGCGVATVTVTPIEVASAP
jgi:rare lipoprotein A